MAPFEFADFPQAGWALLGGLAFAAAGLAGGAGSAAAAASGAFRVNDARFDIRHAYTWEAPFELPQPDGPPIRLRFVALSDRPFDAAKLDLVLDPTADVDLMTVKGAVTITAGIDSKGSVHSLKYGLPGAPGFVMYDISLGDGALQAKEGVYSGKLEILPNRQAHDFDPENWPLVEGSFEFEARDTRSPLEGETLPEGGGAPGAAYRGFNDALVDGDANAIRSRLRSVWTEGGESSPDPLIWRDVMVKNLEILGGRADSSRAVLMGRGEADAFGGQADFRIYLIREAGEWRIDSFQPGHE